MATTAICPASAIFLNVIRGIEMTRTTDEFLRPAFAEEVLADVKARFDADAYGRRDRLSDWQSVCGGAGNHLQE